MTGKVAPYKPHLVSEETEKILHLASPKRQLQLCPKQSPETIPPLTLKQEGEGIVPDCRAAAQEGERSYLTLLQGLQELTK